MTIYVYEDPAAKWVGGWVARCGDRVGRGANLHEAFWDLIAKLRKHG